MAVRDDFAAGEVLAAADLNDTFASKVDYATPTNAQSGTAYTFVAADAERITTASNGSAVTFTIPPQTSVTWGDDTILRVVNYGAGALTVAGGTGVTVTNTAATLAQYQAGAAVRTGSDAWTLVPFAGGGETPAATISSPAATGQYTDSGITYDYYRITATGSLVVDTEGLADVLVVAGGGGGNAVQDGGGGGGSQNALGQSIVLPAGTYTITIGAGGTGTSTSTGNNGTQTTFDTLVRCNPGGGGNRSNFGWPGGGGQGGGGAGGGSTGIGGNIVGLTSSITGTSVEYGRGGGGIGGAGAANTGTGGGGASSGSGSNGGSGVVIVRVKV